MSADLDCGIPGARYDNVVVEVDTVNITAVTILLTPYRTTGHHIMTTYTAIPATVNHHSILNFVFVFVFIVDHIIYS